MKIVIETIPHHEQRYTTLGDYFRDESGVLHILVSKMSDKRAELLVAIHELIEQALTETRGITNEEIDAFDIGHPELDDPGADPRAPYHREHTTATAIEMLLCNEMGMAWADYEVALGEVT